MRVLVTGSRDWTDEAAIEGQLFLAWQEGGGHGAVTLVHGDCPTGADAIADRIWREHSPTSPIERHPADWSRGCKAGPERNAAMVAKGADLCLAFIGPCASSRCHKPEPHDSHGATGCADLAEAAGIPTRRVRLTLEAPRPCPCGCPHEMHIGEIGCPCGLPDEPPCVKETR